MLFYGYYYSSGYGVGYGAAIYLGTYQLSTNLKSLTFGFEARPPCDASQNYYLNASYFFKSFSLVLYLDSLTAYSKSFLVKTSELNLFLISSNF